MDGAALALDAAIWGAYAVACSAVAYLLVAICAVLSLPKRSFPQDALPAITVLKPLCGAEPGLRECLRSFCTQAYPAPLQIVFGVRSATDPALAIARELRAEYPQVDIAIVVNATVHGPNLKVSNLANMASVAKHDILVVSDSDVEVASDCLRRITGAFASDTVGAVTCLFRGAPANPESPIAQLGALYLDAWFLPSAIVDASLSGVTVCYGPVTAIRRSLIEAEGGFQSLAHCLADDTELGHLTTRQGRRIELAPFAVDTRVPETRLGDLWGHELRWAKTTRALRPGSYVASVLTHALPVVLILFACRPSPVSGLLLGSVAALRAVLLACIEARFGRAKGTVSPAPWTLIAREILYFGIWAAAFASRRIMWRGRALRILRGARLEVEPARPSAAREGAIGELGT